MTALALGRRSGPLRGVRVVEIGGIGPGPHACMLLADLGAEVIRIERPGGQALGGGADDLLTRGRPSVVLDLKRPEAINVVLRLVEAADMLIEGLRPGVAERLGFGPEQCHEVNERLVYGRMTGWGQDGPLAAYAGHDLTYIATSGALYGLGQASGRPHFPANLLGDFGGGSAYLVIGVLAALQEARSSGRGQVVDAAIVDGVSHLSAMAWGWLASGASVENRAANLLDGGAPFYDVYETADGRHMAVAALEPKFFQTFIVLLGVADTCPPQDDATGYAEMRELFVSTFATRTMSEWAEIFEYTDACVAPVLRPSEAARHPHLRARGTLVDRDGRVEPGSAPRFSRTDGEIGSPPTAVGASTRAALSAWGIEDVEALIESGVAV